jgi:hypothetical protein
MEQKNSGKAVASLVLGIIGLVCVFFGVYAWIGVIVAVVGLVLGVLAKKEQPSKFASAGVIMSIIAIALCLISFIACIACVGALAAAGSSLNY